MQPLKVCGRKHTLGTGSLLLKTKYRKKQQTGYFATACCFCCLFFVNN